MAWQKGEKLGNELVLERRWSYLDRVGLGEWRAWEIRGIGRAADLGTRVGLDKVAGSGKM